MERPPTYPVNDFDTGVLPGLDLERVEQFLDSACPGMVHDRLRAKIITGGKSNMTYAITDGLGDWVLRRPPLGHVLATAHDMSRECRVIDALRDTDVPVPHCYVLCNDTDVIGAPFYVMEHVNGIAYRGARDLELLGIERTRSISSRMVDVLAALHAVDIADVGLTDFGRPDGFLARQVRRWSRQMEASSSRPFRGVEAIQGLLEARLPPHSAPPAVIHGDYRLDNLLIDQDDVVTAVLDWEMATIGDPLTDVALLLVYQTLTAIVPDSSMPDVSAAPGFLSSGEIAERYASQTGLDLSKLGFHLGLAYFKLAVIFAGIHHRHAGGQTVGDGFDTIGQAVEPLIEAGIASLKGHD